MNISNNHAAYPTVLVLAGLDPSGGAGLAADFGAISSMGAHMLPVATCLTVQDTHDVHKVFPVDSDILQQQLDVLVADMPITTIKIGLLCASETIKLVSNFLQTHPDIPVILDPIIRAGGGKTLLDTSLVADCRNLLAHVDLVTPNHYEALLLANTDSIEDAIAVLLNTGVEHILLTGTDSAHEKSETVVHQYFNHAGEHETYNWPKLLGSYHGSGCTLAAAIAALIANGLDAKTAIAEAQQYTWDTLANALRLTDGQAIPNRFYWSHDS